MGKRKMYKVAEKIETSFGIFTDNNSLKRIKLVRMVDADEINETLQGVEYNGTAKLTIRESIE
jgi:hypothetical protein